MSELPSSSRVWIYTSDRLLSDEEVEYLERDAVQFVQQWAAHGSQLSASIQVKHNLFLVVAADEAQVKATGCSIDSSVNWVKEAGIKYGIDFFNRMNVAFMNEDGAVQLRSAMEMEKLFQDGVINENTLVFNGLVQNLNELEGSFKIPLKESWLFNRMVV